MRFYARPSWRLVVQIVADLFVVLWTFLWWGVGRFSDGVIRALAEPARQTRQVATDLQRQATDAATQASGVPLVGSDLRQPFDGMSTTLRDLAAAAADQVTQIEQAATLIGWLVFAMPTLMLIAVWLPRRLAFASKARETLALVRSSDGTQLLALRALANQPLAELRAAASDPVMAWRTGDPEALGRLAELELATAGVRRPRRRRAASLAG